MVKNSGTRIDIFFIFNHEHDGTTREDSTTFVLTLKGKVSGHTIIPESYCSAQGSNRRTLSFNYNEVYGQSVIHVFLTLSSCSLLYVFLGYFILWLHVIN